MIKSQRLLLPLLAIIIIASSCSSKFSVSKRHYMKGYHVSFAKNLKAKKSQTDNNTKNEALALSLKETKIKNEIVPAALIEQKETIVNTKPSFNTPSKLNKKRPSLAFKDRYLSITNKASNTKNVINALIEKQQQRIHNSASATKQKLKAPFDSMGGGIGSVLLYVFASIIATALMYGLLFLVVAVLSGATLPSWFVGVLLGIGILIVIAIIVVVVINGD